MIRSIEVETSHSQWLKAIMATSLKFIANFETSQVKTVFFKWKIHLRVSHIGNLRYPLFKHRIQRTRSCNLEAYKFKQNYQSKWPSAKCWAQNFAVFLNRSTLARYCLATTASCGSLGSGELSNDCIEIRTVRKVMEAALNKSLFQNRYGNIDECLLLITIDLSTNQDKWRP